MTGLRQATVFPSRVYSQQPHSGDGQSEAGRRFLVEQEKNRKELLQERSEIEAEGKMNRIGRNGRWYSNLWVMNNINERIRYCWQVRSTELYLWLEFAVEKDTPPLNLLKSLLLQQCNVILFVLYCASRVDTALNYGWCFTVYFIFSKSHSM